ncbi:predicted protein [Nematostella vectensis]|uniref:Sushi domain-containing protein n=1 Tax=Nematostella vectensis TaxID=45351 RepID=A7S1U3_NEMVE|nr:predicted protein [Nematostella vectensis]|eukprot:XP_001634364.1 predicted protein [Nematostella vectensis]
MACGVLASASKASPVPYKDVKCKQYPPPAHGQIVCERRDSSKDVHCRVSCNLYYDFEFLAAPDYICSDLDGKWSTQPAALTLPWPNCKIYTRGEPVP